MRRCAAVEENVDKEDEEDFTEQVRGCLACDDFDIFAGLVRKQGVEGLLEDGVM